MPETMDTRLSRLRERAERALASGRRGGDVLTVLETMTREAPDGSAHALFAHRHLAELQLSGSPWRAALHLRRVVQAGAADDSAYALMGLSQALLGNYRTAVSAYRKAIKLAPRNPWYHHNLGHLLDVGLSESVAALDHLRIAQRLQPEEDEIAASLGHCLARLGQLDEARKMAELALRRSPRNREHQTLLEWVQNGAPPDVTPSGRTERRSIRTSAPPPVAVASAAPFAAAPSPATAPTAADPVLEVLATHSAADDMGRQRLERARSLWADFCARRTPKVTKPAVYAAAIEYTLAKLDPATQMTQAELARRYSVAPRSIASRYEEIRAALRLEPGDPRYTGSSTAR
jgi:Flp pilus assembly protein TadD